jgi:hypothetical protein
MPTDPLTRIKQLLLMLLSSEHDGEMAASRDMVVKLLKGMGKNMYWLVDRLTDGGDGADLRREYARGQQAGYQEGFRDAGAAAAARWSRNWTPDLGNEEIVWNDDDPLPTAAIPPQSWAAWLLARRLHRLTGWEQRLCRTLVHWGGQPSEKQLASLQNILRKVFTS